MGSSRPALDRRYRLFLAGAMVLLVAGAGCTMLASSGRAGPAARGVDAARVYAGYRFDRAPAVLSFGVQPLWIPTCAIWEVMSRDQRLRQDLERARCRLDAYPFFKGKDVNEYLGSGKLQGGIAGDLPALTAAAGFDVRIVSLIQQGPCSIIARERRSLKELRGQRIGHAPGSNAHYTLLRVLRENGLRPTDVRLVPMDVTAMAAALAERRIDAFSAWEPTATLAVVDHPSFEVLERTDARGYIYFARPFFERHPAVVRAIVASEVRALRWLRTNEKNLYIASGWARKRAVEFAGADRPTTVYDFHRLARRDILRVPEAPRLLPALLAPMGELFQQFRLSRNFGLIPAGADWNRIRQSFAVDVVPQVLSSAPGDHLESLRLAKDPVIGGIP